MATFPTIASKTSHELCSDETADEQSAEGGALEEVAWDFGTPATI
jgi:hypothetical protein